MMQIAGAIAAPSLVRATRAPVAAPRRTVARAEMPGGPSGPGGPLEDLTKAVPEVSNDVSDIFPGDISRENAERRANIGIPGQKAPTFGEAQAFDGPAPESINGRLAMLGTFAALIAEFNSGIGVREQVSSAPVSIIATFAIISLASYIPIARGYTRKEPFANAFWSVKAENWNGRAAMMGFTALIITEAISGLSTVDYWGLPHGTTVTPGFM